MEGSSSLYVTTMPGFGSGDKMFLIYHMTSRNQVFKGLCDLMDWSFLCIAWKVSEYGVFSGPCFPVFSPNKEKYGSEKTSYLDIFHAVITSRHFATFSGHRPCGSSDAAAKIFYVTLQDYVIKGSSDFMEENSSLYIPTLPKLIAINIVLMDI